MKKYAWTILWVLFQLTSQGQNSFTGVFMGTANGDPLKMELKQNSDGSCNGKLDDSQQTYTIKGKVAGNVFTGKATEAAMGIEFELLGKWKNNLLMLTVTFNQLGVHEQNTYALARQKGATPAVANKQPATQQAGSAKGKPRDKNLVGTWTAQSGYSSGYGDNQMSGSVRESLIFKEDGRLLNGGSSASVSGSDYSGSSSGGGGETGLKWYTNNSQIYLEGYENGQLKTVHLGRYYIENGKLLITGDNGTKKLLYKSD